MKEKKNSPAVCIFRNFKLQEKAKTLVIMALARLARMPSEKLFRLCMKSEAGIDPFREIFASDNHEVH